MFTSLLKKQENPRVHNRYHKSAPPGAVLIDRSTKWGNPFIVGIDGERGECVDLFERWAMGIPELIADAKRELKGRHLVCYCYPRKCHGDILFRIAIED